MNLDFVFHPVFCLGDILISQLACCVNLHVFTVLDTVSKTKEKDNNSLLV